MAKPPGLTYFPESLKVPYGPYMGASSRVVDGDTFVAVLNFGAERYPHLAVRIYGINAPEHYQPGGDEATAYLESLLPRDTPCVIRSHGWSFGRIVGSVLLKDGADVATEMVRANHAVWREY